MQYAVIMAGEPKHLPLTRQRRGAVQTISRIFNDGTLISVSTPFSH